MHLSRTDLNLFVVFEAIYAQGGVSRAADQLNLSQPAISHALRRLRERVNDELFVRNGQTLAPTPAARAMIGPVREALRLFDRTLGSLEAFDGQASAMHFTIGMRSLMESSYLLPLVVLMKEQAPAVTVSSVGFERSHMAMALSSGELNAVIDVFLPNQDGVIREHLATDRTVVVARRGHPTIDERLDLEDYIAATHVCVTSRPMGTGPEDVALSRMGRSRNISLRCQELNTAMRLVATTDMVLTMSESYARRANVWFDHQILPAPFEAAPIDTFLYWHRISENDPANIWFRAAIRSAFN